MRLGLAVADQGDAEFLFVDEPIASGWGDALAEGVDVLVDLGFLSRR